MLNQAESSSLKSFSDYTLSELIDMKKEQFDTILEHDKSNVGYLSSFQKLMSLQYDSIKIQVAALSEMAVDKNTDEETKLKCLSTIKSMYGILFSLEYKACAVHQKALKLMAQT